MSKIFLSWDTKGQLCAKGSFAYNKVFGVTSFAFFTSLQETYGWHVWELLEELDPLFAMAFVCACFQGIWLVS